MALGNPKNLGPNAPKKQDHNLGDNEASGLGDQRQPWYPKKRRRRLKLVVSSSDENNNNCLRIEKDLNGFDFMSPWNRCLSVPSPRPLKSVMEILAVAPQADSQEQDDNRIDEYQEGSKANNKSLPVTQQKLPPILVKFLKEKNLIITNDDESEENETKNETQKNKQDPLSDSQNSTITEPQHLRYLHLLNEFRTNDIKITSKRFKKEFKALTSLIQEERRSYIEILKKYQVENKERFLLGFKVPCKASQHTATNAKLIKGYHKSWLRLSLPTKFGKCYQEISVKSTLISTDSRTNESEYMANLITRTEQNKKYDTHSNSRDKISMDIFLPKIVGMDSPLDLPTTKEKLKGLEGLQFILPQNVLPHTFLFQDKMAKNFAIKHNAEVVITAEAMETLLQRPESERTNWKMPIYSELVTSESSDGVELPDHTSRKKRQITFIDDPIPSPSSARDWLSKGLQEALHQSTISKLSATNGKSFQSVYTLLTLPSSTLGSQKSTTVLVRSKNFLVDDDQSKDPVQLFAQLQYFPERGREELSSHEKSIVLLKKMLQPKCKVYAAHINPKDVTIIDFQELFTELLLGIGNTVDVNIFFNGNNADIHKNFQTMNDIISGAKMTRIGWNVLSLPGVGVFSSPLTTISVHSSIQYNVENEAIDLNQEFTNAEAVLLSDNALLKCFKMWTWSAPHAVFTFPFLVSQKK